MAFEQGIATTQEDLISKLATFLTGNGWTQDNLDVVNNKASFSKGTIFVHFQWDGTEGGGPNNIAMYHSLGFIAAGTNSWSHTNDSGNGVASTLLNTQRRVSGIGNGTFTQYYFFLDTVPDSVWIVLEYSPGLFRHFGFGSIEKIGDWTGGEFVAGHVWNDGSTSDPISTAHSLSLDGLHQATAAFQELSPATMHVEGLPNQVAGGKWANVGSGSTAAWFGNDRAAVARIGVQGGTRAGGWLRHFAITNANPLNGFIPLIPLPVHYIDRVPAIDEKYLLGFIPNQRHVQMELLVSGQELTIGGDTWKIFPGVRKTNVAQEESENMGVAYKKVV